MVVAVEVRLGGDASGVAPRAYTAVLEQVTYALEEIDRIAHPTRTARPQWSVTRTGWAEAGPTVVLTPSADPRRRSSEEISRPARALVDGVLVLGSEPQIPDLFSEGIVERITSVRAQIEKRKLGLNRVTLISVNGSRSQPAHVDELVGRNAEAAVAAASYAYGSLTGTLDVISSRRQRRRIGLLPDHGPAVTCNVDKLSSEDVVRAFDKRVIVAGLLRRNGRGQAVRLDADYLELAPRGVAVSADDLLGAAPELGGDLSLADYIASQRAR